MQVQREKSIKERDRGKKNTSLRTALSWTASVCLRFSFISQVGANLKLHGSFSPEVRENLQKQMRSSCSCLQVLRLLIPKDQASSWDFDKRMSSSKPLMTLPCICCVFTEPGASPVILPKSFSSVPAEIQKPSLWGKSSQSPKAEKSCCAHFPTRSHH